MKIGELRVFRQTHHAAGHRLRKPPFVCTPHVLPKRMLPRKQVRCGRLIQYAHVAIALVLLKLAPLEQ
jgi:hypothetical protein